MVLCHSVSEVRITHKAFARYGSRSNQITIEMEVRLVKTSAGFSKILCGPYSTEVTKILQQAAFPEHRAPGTRKKFLYLCSSIESPFDHQIRRERRLGMGSKRSASALS